MWLLAALFLLLIAAGPASAAEPAALATARALHNAGDYDAAIASASAVRADPQYGNAAALVVARAHLERFRRAAAPADLAAARATLSAIRPADLAPRDHADLIVGLGLALYLGEQFGAAAELFDSALGRADVLPPADRLLLLDWWATALDRDAQQRPADRRPAAYERIERRMSEVLAADPGNAIASYWLAAAARGAGNLDRAWDAAVAGWVRASLTPDRAATLRADLDRLVTEALIPERARARPARERETAADELRLEWEKLKADWDWAPQ